MIPQEYIKDSHKPIQWSVVAVLVVLALFLAVQTIQSFTTMGEEDFPSKTLFVSGEGEVIATPDVAQFTFTVTEEADSVAEAQNAVTENINVALTSLEELGVEERDIKTTSYNAYPRYTYAEVTCLATNCPQPGERVLSGYEVSQTVSVKVRDTADAGEALSQVAQAGISNVSGLSFVVDDQDALIAEARSQAIADAESKVQDLAEDLNVKVVGVVGFYEHNRGSQPYYAEYGMGGDAQTQRSSAPELPTGENSIRVQVEVTYEIK